MRRERRERFLRHRLQRKPLISDPGIHHGTCVTHVPWCMSGSLTRGGGENIPGIPDACATRKFMYLARGPLKLSTEKSILTAPSHYLNRCWTRSMSPYGVIMQQWVKGAVGFRFSQGLPTLTCNNARTNQVVANCEWCQAITWAYAELPPTVFSSRHHNIIKHNSIISISRYSTRNATFQCVYFMQHRRELFKCLQILSRRKWVN